MHEMYVEIAESENCCVWEHVCLGVVAFPPNLSLFAEKNAKPDRRELSNEQRGGEQGGGWVR